MHNATLKYPISLYMAFRRCQEPRNQELLDEARIYGLAVPIITIRNLDDTTGQLLEDILAEAVGMGTEFRFDLYI